MKVTVFLLFYIFLLLPAFAEEGGGLVEPLEWQKVKLEEQIARKVSSNLGKLIDAKLFIVEVDVVANSPARPDFFMQTSEETLSALSFSDVKKKDIPKDTLFFSKFGMEAPTIQKQNKLEIVQGVKIAQIWDYNQSMNIFNNIESFTVAVRISETIDKELREKIEMLVNSIKLPIADVKPTIKFEYVDYIAPLEKVKTIVSEKEVTKSEKESLLSKVSTVDTLSKFSVMIGMIIGAIFLAISILLRGRKTKIDEVANVPSPAQQSNENESVEVPPDFNHSLMSPPDVSESMEYSFARFKNFLDSDSALAATIVKEWLGSGRAGHVILKVIADRLSTESLEKIFEHLNEDDRKLWRESVYIELSLAEKISAAASLKNRVTSEIISPSVRVDDEITNLLLKTPPSSIVKILKEDFEAGCLLMSIVSVDFSAKILKLLKPKNLQKVAERTLEMDIKNELADEEMVESLKEILRNYKVDKDALPGIGKIRNMLSATSYESEAALWTVLKSKLNKVELIEEAKRVFPSELVFMLSESFIKNLMRRISLDKKVELLMSLTKNDREAILNGFAPADGQVRSMLELEMERRSNDFAFKKRVVEKADEIWASFIAEVRADIKTQYSAEEEVNVLIEAWADSAENGTEGDNESHLELEYSKEAA